MTISKTEVHIWIMVLDLSSARNSIGFALLSADEKARARRFHSILHQQRFIAAHAGLRIILSRYLEISPEKVTFAYTTFGKPYIPSHPALQFNLSHSQDKAILAITYHQSIGADLEKIKTNYQLALAERFFHPAEIAYLQQASIQPENKFYDLWTRKEAILKAIGTGLRIPLNSFSVVNENNPSALIKLQNENWRILSLSLLDGFTSAIASNQEINKTTILHLENGDDSVSFVAKHQVY